MAKGKILTKFEQARSVELQRRGLWQQGIPNEIGRSRTVLFNSLKIQMSMLLKNQVVTPINLAISC